MSRSLLSWPVAIVFALVVAVAAAFFWRKAIRNAISVSEIKPPAEAAANDLPPRPARGDWPWWRGVAQRNISEFKGIPTEWEEGKNVAWKEPLEGRGHASPIARGEDAFVFAADEDKQEHLLEAIFNCQSLDQLDIWQRERERELEQWTMSGTRRGSRETNGEI